jgi:hypothetical protein
MHAAARVIINHHPKTVYTKPLSLLLDYKIFQTGRATRVNFPLAHTDRGTLPSEDEIHIFHQPICSRLYKCAPTY